MRGACDDVRRVRSSGRAEHDAGCRTAVRRGAAAESRGGDRPRGHPHPRRPADRAARAGPRGRAVVPGRPGRIRRRRPVRLSARRGARGGVQAPVLLPARWRRGVRAQPARGAVPRRRGPHRAVRQAGDRAGLDVLHCHRRGGRRVRSGACHQDHRPPGRRPVGADRAQDVDHERRPGSLRRGLRPRAGRHQRVRGGLRPAWDVRHADPGDPGSLADRARPGRGPRPGREPHRRGGQGPRARGELARARPG